MRPQTHLTADEVRAALRAAACQLAAKLPDIHDADRSETEVVYTPGGAVIVQFVPRCTIKVPATTAILNLAEFAAELEQRRLAAGLLSDAQRDAGTVAVTDPATGQRRPSPIEAEIRKVCSHGAPLKGSTIARRLNREYDSYIRGVLASMVKRGVLRRSSSGGGYVLDS